jgi:hypothetical protein
MIGEDEAVEVCQALHFGHRAFPLLHRCLLLAPPGSQHTVCEEMVITSRDKVEGEPVGEKSAIIVCYMTESSVGGMDVT